MDFDHFIVQAWVEHVTDATAVAQRLQSEGLAGVSAPDHVAPLATLAHHVLGQHLQRWQDGLALLQALQALPACEAGSVGAATVARYIASLRLCAGQADALQDLGSSERIRVQAMAAANLAEHDAARAMALFQQALQTAQASALPDTDPCNPVLAITGNNLAAALEQKTGRSADERALMIAAAQAGRRYWALAGTWEEIQRAEYRLAMTWLQAGDAARSRHHAQACLDILQAHDGPAFERLFGLEALAHAAHAGGDAAAQTQAAAQAQTVFETLNATERAEAQATLNEIQALAAPGPLQAPR